MRVLVIGGTRFIGRHFTDAALAAGHELTLFHRGVSSAEPIVGAFEILGDRDRDRDLSALARGEWDAVVDFCAYRPSQIASLGRALEGRVDDYLLVSSTAVYAPPNAYGYDEDAPLLDGSQLAPDCAVTRETYGPLKVECEKAASGAFPRALLIRPTYVVGPLDYTQRFDYWIKRIAKGGRVLAPGPRDAWFQVIDARDLAAWMLSLLVRGIDGTFHAASPFPPMRFEAVLETIAEVVAPPGAELVWVDRDWLLSARIDDGDLPLWPGANPDGVLEALDPARALQSGLDPRSLIDTVRETVECSAQLVDEPSMGLTFEREQELLAQVRRS